MPARTSVLATRNGARGAKSKPRSQSKAALNSAQNSATNNNSVVRRKSKTADQENKLSNSAKSKHHKPASPQPGANGHESDTSSPKEVQLLSLITIYLFPDAFNDENQLIRVSLCEQRKSRANGFNVSLYRAYATREFLFTMLPLSSFSFHL